MNKNQAEGKKAKGRLGEHSHSPRLDVTKHCQKNSTIGEKAAGEADTDPPNNQPRNKEVNKK